MRSPLLLPYQQAWIADTSQVRVAEKSRRIGWTWTAACEAVIDASSASGQDVWYTSYNKDVTEEFIRDCKRWARAFSLASSDGDVVSSEADELIYSLRFPSGHRISALTSKPRNLRYKRGHLIIDEAAFHDELSELLKAAFAVLVWGGRVDVISTHNGVSNPFNVLVEEIRGGKKPYSLHRCTLDEAVSQGLFKRICLVTGRPWSDEIEDSWRKEIYDYYGHDADEELRCVPARSGGVYLSRSLVESRMVDGPVLQLDLPDDFLSWPKDKQDTRVDQFLSIIDPHLIALDASSMHAVGEDFGRTSDRTVVTVGEIGDDLSVRSKLSVELCRVPFGVQRTIVFAILDRVPRLTRAAFDATGNGSEIAEAASIQYGADVVEQVKLSARWYSTELPKFKAALESGTLSVLRHAEHLLDLTQFVVQNGEPRLLDVRRRVGKGLPPRHGDAAIAYVLMYYASQMQLLSYEGYTSAAKHDRHSLGVGIKWPEHGGLL